ncbi:MAG: hypothetical protein DWI21_04130, partial [Planctomycetota bacterium]
ARGWIRPNERVVIFNTGAAQKYVEAIRSDLPRLDVNSSIDWERLASGGGSLPPTSHAVAVALTHSEVVVADEAAPVPVESIAAVVEPPSVTEPFPAEAPENPQA